MTFLAFGLHKLLFEFNPLRRATSVLKQTISIPQLKIKVPFSGILPPSASQRRSASHRLSPFGLLIQQEIRDNDKIQQRKSCK